MLAASTIQLLRFHFSFLLLPVYLFALSQVPDPDPVRSALVFFILHLLVYPSSNGYNSYMDRDESPIGGIRSPMVPTKQLYQVSIVLDLVAIALSLIISGIFAAGILAYIFASRSYSYRGIRLKKYPILGYLVVMIFQGAVTYFLAYHGCSNSSTLEVPLTAMLASSLLIGGFYPLTQIYQHQSDKADGVTTISYMLGYRGTFIFTALIYSAAMLTLWLYFDSMNQQKDFVLLATFMLPILVFFFVWAAKVWKDPLAADFRNTMRMNLLAAICTNTAFLSLLIRRFI